MFLTVLLFLVGLAIIIKGGDWFVEAAVWVAEVTGVPKMLIGATIVSLATTLPELFVSVIAVANDATGLGVGNAIGSIICNTGLILAISLLVRPGAIEDPQMFYKKAAIMVLSLVVLFIETLDKTLSALDSIPIFALLLIFIYSNIHQVKKNNLARDKEIRHIETHKTVGLNILKFAAGAAGIVGGAKLLVSNGTQIASNLGISDGLIGVTIVALGTSLPELVTTITALKKKEPAMGIGNILGANILNITLILSTCAVISGGGISIDSEYMPVLSRVLPRSIYIDMPVVALLFAILIIPPILMKGKLKRFQGVLMLGIYVLFIGFLVFNV